MDHPPLPPAQASRHVVALEAAGFITIAAAIWLDELWDLPHLLLGSPSSPFRPGEAVAESVLVLLLGAGIVLWSRRVLARVAYLESFVVVCAWCHRVKLDEQWVGLEQFLREHRATTSHGICPICARDMLAEADAEASGLTPPA
jgi:hypothetical protein